MAVRAAPPVHGPARHCINTQSYLLLVLLLLLVYCNACVCYCVCVCGHARMHVRGCSVGVAIPLLCALAGKRTIDFVYLLG
jgi:hypothetical protein